MIYENPLYFRGCDIFNKDFLKIILKRYQDQVVISNIDNTFIKNITIFELMNPDNALRITMLLHPLEELVLCTNDLEDYLDDDDPFTKDYINLFDKYHSKEIIDIDDLIKNNNQRRILE